VPNGAGNATETYKAFADSYYNQLVVPAATAARARAQAGYTVVRAIVAALVAAGIATVAGRCRRPARIGLRLRHRAALHPKRLRPFRDTSSSRLARDPLARRRGWSWRRAPPPARGGRLAAGRTGRQRAHGLVSRAGHCGLWVRSCWPVYVLSLRRGRFECVLARGMTRAPPVPAPGRDRTLSSLRRAPAAR
jgi:hypothetical protein